MANELALRTIASVPRPLPRERMEAAIRAFQASYAIQDVETRVALFADNAVFEDPVGVPPIRGKAAIERFFRDTIASGIAIALIPERIVFSGGEALCFTKATFGFAGEEPSRVRLFQTFAFDADCLITSVRVYFDETCLL